MYLILGKLLGAILAIIWLWLIITKRGRRLIYEELASNSETAKLIRIAEDPEDKLYLGEKIELIFRISGYLVVGFIAYFAVVYLWPTWIIIIGGVYISVLRDDARKKRKKQRRNR